jgi:hypothetical protein
MLREESARPGRSPTRGSGLGGVGDMLIAGASAAPLDEDVDEDEVAQAAA